MYNHALCIFPYRSDGFHAGFLPPLGLELIASVLEPSCRSLEIVDLRKGPGRAIDFCRPETDLVCFSINWKRDVEFIREEIRSVQAGAFILLGGRHVTENPEGWFAACPSVDAIVRGDGEEAVEELCRGDPLEGITGLSFRKNGQILHNSNRTPGHLREDLLPARHLRKECYRLGLEGVEPGILIDMSSSRGCPFNCNFCSFSRNPWGYKQQWSARSPESVAEELARIEAPVVAFTDDLFTFDMDKVDRICDLILARGIRKKYIINARLEIAWRPEVLRKMEKAGFFMLMLGIESTQDKTLRSMRKGFDTARIRDCFKVLSQSSMMLNGYFILGNIGESVEEMLQIVPFSRELGLDSIAISILRSSPYSGLDELVAENPGYHNIAPNGKIYSDQCSVRQLRDLHHRIYREFYTPGQLFRIARKGIRHGALRFLPRVLPQLPILAWSVARNYRKHAQRRQAMEAAAKTAAI